MKIPEAFITPDIRHQGAQFVEVAPGTPFQEIFKHISKEKYICLTGTYGFAMSFYAWLKKRVADRYPVKDYLSSRQYRKVLHRYQSLIWIKISGHRPCLEKAPTNPWLHEFYPDEQAFYITFAEYLGMNGAWQWYEHGIKYPVLDHRIHPFYGVYFPTRHDHLFLLDQWLIKNKRFKRAIDVGTGCGVLAFLMHNRGIRDIHATDINQNAIYGLQQEIVRQGKKQFEGIFPEHASLLGSFQPASENLIVFNPPWIPDIPEKMLDRASYFEQGFFDLFFDEMTAKCPAGTTLLIFFSNYAILAGITNKHPIEEAIKQRNEGFEIVSHSTEPVRQAPSGNKTWLQSIRTCEQVELFELKRR